MGTFIHILTGNGQNDIPGTFNAGATLGPVNPVRSKTSKMSADVQAHRTSNGVNETNMARIWNPSIKFRTSHSIKLMTGKHKQSNTPLKRKVFVVLSRGVSVRPSVPIYRILVPSVVVSIYSFRSLSLYTKYCILYRAYVLYYQQKKKKRKLRADLTF